MVVPKMSDHHDRKILQNWTRLILLDPYGHSLEPTLSNIDHIIGLNFYI